VDLENKIMAYGNAQRLGQTIDPSLMRADYSGYANAGAILGNTLANVGQDIGNAIKTSKQNQRDIDAGIAMATSIKKAIPEMAEMADGVLGQLSNSELSTNQKLAALDGIREAMKIQLLGKQESRADALLKLQQDELLTKLNAPRAISAPATKEVGDGKGGTITLQWDSVNGEWFPIGKNIRGINNNAANSVALPEEPIAQQKDQSLFSYAGDVVRRGLGFGRNQDQDPEEMDYGVLPTLNGYPNYGTFEDATRLPASDVPPTEGGVGYTPPKTEAQSKPELITLPDGTKAYGSFENGVFVPAKTAKGEKMTVKEEEMTPVQKAEFEAKQIEKQEKNISAVDQSEQFLSALEKLENHEGFNNLFGSNIGVPTFWPGSSGADAKAILEQIDAKAFMESIKSLKGMGALSDAEGKKASAAFIALKPSMSEDAAKKTIQEAKNIVRKGIERARGMGLNVESSLNQEDVEAARLQKLLNPNR
jgi:hypothetical protein